MQKEGEGKKKWKTDREEEGKGKVG